MSYPVYIRICQVYGATAVPGNPVPDCERNPDPDPEWKYRTAIDDSEEWIDFVDWARGTWWGQIANPNAKDEWHALGVSLTKWLNDKLAKKLSGKYKLLGSGGGGVSYVPAYDEKGRLIGHAVIFGIADSAAIKDLHVTPHRTYGALHGFVSMRISL